MGWFERLSPLDATFLAIEDTDSPMHVGAVAVFDAAPLTLEHGGVDIELLRAYIDAAIHRVPRYRQRLLFVPLLKHPVWVDDHRFNIHYHVRHTAVPRPGDPRQLKRLAARVFSQKLDRDRPLWEIWVVEGLEGGRFALIAKAHHCMMDGVAGVGLMASLMRLNGDQSIPEAPPWKPRRPPNMAELIGAELRHRAVGATTLWDRVRDAASGRGEWAERAREAAHALVETVGDGVVPASHTPLAGDLGPHRRFDVTTHPLVAVKAIKNAHGGKVNDVVLATVTGALRRFFAHRGVDPDEVDDFRAFVPVSVRKQDQRGTLGNRVSMMLTRLPLAEPERLARYAAVVAETERLKGHPDAIKGTEFFAEATEWTGAGLLAGSARLLSQLNPYNIVVTNVPGPPFPLYLCGARLAEIYPLVPLYGHQCVGIAIFSYAGVLHWGLSADWQAVPDLHHLVDAIDAEFAALRDGVR
jgi:WS/DGAT/MGAT family acyltransferase